MWDGDELTYMIMITDGRRAVVNHVLRKRAWGIVLFFSSSIDLVGKKFGV